MLRTIAIFARKTIQLLPHSREPAHTVACSFQSDIIFESSADMIRHFYFYYGRILRSLAANHLRLLKLFHWFTFIHASGYCAWALILSWWRGLVQSSRFDYDWDIVLAGDVFAKISHDSITISCHFMSVEALFRLLLSTVMGYSAHFVFSPRLILSCRSGIRI